eukprot:gnl/TRDRNA2_/TRDRNA2_131800_c0_seq1.p1 gnl/TRDRNA2_/TRDRNA2_131800_c0~~gnl/TRDRNA2_/TRDRNA2_131800_c0_seq1.p1  ORF type:complete len:124 (+),score=47.47 gnl/TRDRNA2_/TRDRNA2_131800_c0_seq1:2-373(+)
MKAMKAMRVAKKAKRPSKVARGRFAKSLVLKGKKEKTVGGLTKDMLIKNKRGKVVSKRASAQGKRKYKQIESWVESFMAARESLKVQGFVAINGKSLQGKAIYVRAKALHREKKAEEAANAAA